MFRHILGLNFCFGTRAAEAVVISIFLINKMIYLSISASDSRVSARRLVLPVRYKVYHVVHAYAVH